MNSFVIKAIVDELKTDLFSSGFVKVNGIIQTDTNTICIKLKGGVSLIIKMFPQSPGLFYSRIPSRGKGLKTPFSNILSNCLTGSEILAISLDALERNVSFKILQFRAGQPINELLLIAELITRSPCLILINAETHEIITCSRGSQTPKRHIAPGEIYEPLSRPQIIEPLQIDINNWQDFINNWQETELLEDYLLHNIFGLNTLIIREIIFRSGISSFDDRNKRDIANRLWIGLKEMLKIYSLSSKVIPSVILYDDKNSLPLLSSFTPASIPLMGVNIKTFAKMNEAALFYYTYLDETWVFRQKRDGLINAISKEMRKSGRRLRNIQHDINTFKQDERAKDYGDLIMANLHFIKKGLREILIPDLYQGGEVTITLDPSKNPIQNARAYYKRHKKAQRGLSVTLKREKATLRAIKDLKELTVRLQDPQCNAHDLGEVTAFLKNILQKDGAKASLKLPLTQLVKKDKQPKKDIPAGIKVFKIDESWTIIVGRTDKANDYLTKYLANPLDVWFHVKDAPGSHVVLKNPKKLDAIPLEILLKTAGITAFFSKLKKEQKVLVTYTRKRHVHKPKGMKPGQVVISNEKVLVVTPEHP